MTSYTQQSPASIAHTARLLAAMHGDAFAASAWPGGPTAWDRHIAALVAKLPETARRVYEAEMRCLSFERTDPGRFRSFTMGRG